MSKNCDTAALKKTETTLLERHRLNAAITKTVPGDSDWGAIRVERGLRPPQGEVVAILVFFDDPFQRTVRHVEIPGFQQAERRQDSRQPSVAVLKRMDGQKMSLPSPQCLLLS